jgi:hypothetical protein
MIAESIRPDSATMANVLPAYAESADLLQAKNIDTHCFLLILGFLGNTEIATSLIDVYAKASDLGHGFSSSVYLKRTLLPGQLSLPDMECTDMPKQPFCYMIGWWS